MFCIDKNAAHGSDSAQTAVAEIAFFFKPSEIFPRTQLAHGPRQ